MKSYPSDYPNLISRFHHTFSSVEIVTGSSAERPLLITGGDVTHDRLGATHSTTTFTLVDPTGETSLAAADDLFEPLVHEVAIYKGVYYPHNPVPVTFRQGVMRVTNVDAREDDGRITIEVEAFDRSERIRTPRVTPLSLPADIWWDIDIRTLIRGQNPNADFTDNWPLEDPSTVVPGRMKAPQLTIDAGGDVWAKCLDGFANIGKAGFAADDGRFDLRDIPDVNIGVPVWTYAHGLNAGHVATSKARRGDDTFNGVIVKGLNGATGEFWNDDPASRTSRINIEARAKTIDANLTDPVQCETRAQSELKRILDTAETITFTALCNPALETGDLIRYRHPRLGIDGNYIVNRIVQPLSLVGLMSVTAAGHTARVVQALGSPPSGTPDTQAPSVPQSLIVQTYSASHIELAWQASTDNVGVAYYGIYRDGVNTSLYDSSPFESYIDTGVGPGETHTYRVNAFDAAGNNSAKSNSVEQETKTDTTAPSQPLNLSATVT